MRRLKRLAFFVLWPGLYLYFRPSHRARVVLTDGKRIVLVQARFALWFADDALSLPGGGRRRGEAAASAAVRELQEELGLNIAESSLQSLGQVTVRDQGLRYECELLLGHIDPATRFQPRQHEVVSAAWYDLQDMGTLRLRPDVRLALTAWSQQNALLQ